ncbi:MAG: amidase family protein [Pseudomonadota bacterium]
MDRRTFSQLAAASLGAAATGACQSLGTARNVGDPTQMGIRELHEAFSARELDPVAVAEEFLARIEATQPTINAYSFVNRDGAIADAQAARQRFANGTAIGPLDGIPLAFKDQYQVAGMQRRFGSALRASSAVDLQDEEVVARMRAAGCVILGKTTQCDEGALSLSRSSATGNTRNPAARDCHAGGSSSGSGAAAAARLGPIQMGADQGGSIREPASLTGCFGFKPSTGLIPLVSEYGVYGPIAAQLADIRPVLETASGRSLVRTDLNLSELRIAYMPYCGDGMPPDPAVKESCAQAIDRLNSSGLKVTEVEPPLPYGVLKEMATPFYAGGISQIVSDFGFEAVLAQGERCFAKHVEATSKLDANLIRQLSEPAFGILDQALETHPVHDYDIVLTPTLSFRAFPLERCHPVEAEATPDFDSWVARYGLSQEHSVALAIATYMKTPEITFPVARRKSEKPVGLSAVASREEDALLLEFAELVEPMLVDG